MRRTHLGNVVYRGLGHRSSSRKRPQRKMFRTDIRGVPRLLACRTRFRPRNFSVGAFSRTIDPSTKALEPCSVSRWRVLPFIGDGRRGRCQSNTSWRAVDASGLAPLQTSEGFRSGAGDAAVARVVLGVVHRLGRHDAGHGRFFRWRPLRRAGAAFCKCVFLIHVILPHSNLRYSLV